MDSTQKTHVDINLSPPSKLINKTHSIPNTENKNDKDITEESQRLDLSDINRSPLLQDRIEAGPPL